MNPDQLRALADAVVYRDSLAIARAADYLRAQADAQPVRAVPIGHALSAVRHVGSANYPDRERAAIERLYSAEFDAYTRPAPAAPQAEPKREPLSDEQVTKGEYVLATKFGDGDPGDHWGVGFYDRFANGRHYVVDSAGKQIRGNGFRRVGRITVDVGRWFLSAGRSLEASPPGTVNLWTMLTERAHRIGGTDPALDDLQAKERA